MKEGDQLSASCHRPRLVITSVSDLSAAKTEGGDSERKTDNWGEEDRGKEQERKLRSDWRLKWVLLVYRKGAKITCW